jgi:hypothetical protein
MPETKAIYVASDVHRLLKVTAAELEVTSGALAEGLIAVSLSTMGVEPPERFKDLLGWFELGTHSKEQVLGFLAAAAGTTPR